MKRKRPDELDTFAKGVELFRQVMDTEHPKKYKDTQILNIRKQLLRAKWDETAITNMITAAIYSSQWNFHGLEKKVAAARAAKRAKRKQTKRPKKIVITLPKPKPGLRGGINAG